MGIIDEYLAKKKMEEEYAKYQQQLAIQSMPEQLQGDLQQQAFSPMMLAGGEQAVKKEHWNAANNRPITPAAQASLDAMTPKTGYSIKDVNPQATKVQAAPSTTKGLIMNPKKRTVLEGINRFIDAPEAQ